MSGVQRFLSRRDKKYRPRSPAKPDSRPTTSNSRPPEHFLGVCAHDIDPKASPDKDEERRVQGLVERLRQHGIHLMNESHVRYALRTTASRGDGDAAFHLLVLLQETFEGIVRPYNPNLKLKGAVNRESVTCYLDALLFAMFVKLDSFEAMLYDNFEDAPRKRLAGLLRLWVNFLRAGWLITTDITGQIQQALAACGWDDAAKLRQQDPSEAFTFITGQLELPLLTLKMDLYHVGREDAHDDHKFVNERLLEVAILDAPPEGNSVITLEHCLEHYFNTRIEVRRYMENQRRNTSKSAISDVKGDLGKSEAESGTHIEVLELDGPGTPITQTPLTESPLTPVMTKDPLEKLRPTQGRRRNDSIFSQRRVEVSDLPADASHLSGTPAAPELRDRKLSTKTEVLMPAWQFFQLLPWYTDNVPTSDAQVAAHFSRKRPVLGICLKRYAYSNTGQATRLNTFIDIPLEIQVPNFMSDEHMTDNGPLFGNFRLLLQSVVCHRGQSVHSGHYVSLCRSQGSKEGIHRSSAESDDGEDPWMRFDDLAKERVSHIDIREALRQETPYLLFYQVQPIGEDGQTIHDLPSYEEATSRSQSDAAILEKPDLHGRSGSEQALVEIPAGVDAKSSRGDDEKNERRVPSGRVSFEAGALEGRRGRSSLQIDDIRSADHGSVSGGSILTATTASIPSTPSEEKKDSGFLSVAGKMGTRRGNRSRPSSADPDAAGGGGRFSLNMTKLTQRISRSDSSAPAHASEGSSVDAVPVPASTRPTDVDPVVGRLSTSDPSAQRLDPAGEPLSTAPDALLATAGKGSTDSVNTAKPSTGHSHSHSRSQSHPLSRSRMLEKQAARRANKTHEDRECVVM